MRYELFKNEFLLLGRSVNDFVTQTYVHNSATQGKVKHIKMRVASLIENPLPRSQNIPTTFWFAQFL